MNNRNHGIDLFRIFLTFNVCLLHILKQGGLLFSENLNSIQFYIVWLLQSFAICAVDGYALISGYISNNLKQKYERIIKLWFQVLFYSLVLTLLLHLIGYKTTWDIKNILSCLFPVSSGTYWYFTAYFGLFFLMPFIDKALKDINEKEAKKILIILFFVFVVIGVLYDVYFTDKGKNVFWLALMYVAGILVRKSKVFENKSSFILFVYYLMTVLLSWSVKIVLGNRKLISNISPTVVLGSILLLIIFSRIRVNKTIISYVSSLTFGIYLFQNNTIIWNLLEDSMIWNLKTNNVLSFVVYILLCALLLFVVGMIVEMIRKYLEKILNIDKLSEKIFNFVNRLVNELLEKK